MVRSKNLDDKKKYEIVLKELEEFKRLIKGHEKLLKAIGNL